MLHFLLHISHPTKIIKCVLSILAPFDHWCLCLPLMLSRDTTLVSRCSNWRTTSRITCVLPRKVVSKPCSVSVVLAHQTSKCSTRLPLPWVNSHPMQCRCFLVVGNLDHLNQSPLAVWWLPMQRTGRLALARKCSTVLEGKLVPRRAKFKPR